jgi:hypothetical protein
MSIHQEHGNRDETSRLGATIDLDVIHERWVAADLNALYEDWWAHLDGIERRSARAYLGSGIHEDTANTMEAAGISLAWGLVADAAGVRRVRLAPTSLRTFIATNHPAAAHGTAA